MRRETNINRGRSRRCKADDMESHEDWRAATAANINADCDLAATYDAASTSPSQCSGSSAGINTCRHRNLHTLRGLCRAERFGTNYKDPARLPRFSQEARRERFKREGFATGIDLFSEVSNTYVGSIAAHGGVPAAIHECRCVQAGSCEITSFRILVVGLQHLFCCASCPT